MGTYARLRRFSLLVFAFLALSGAAQAQFALSLETKEVESASTVTMVVTSNGAIDLSGITAQQVRFFDLSLGDNQRGGMGARTVEATARRLTVTAAIGNPARVLGRRHMLLMFGETFVAFPFTLVRPFVCPASCRPPSRCVNKQCVPTKCNPHCKLPLKCNEERGRCERPPT